MRFNCAAEMAPPEPWGLGGGGAGGPISIRWVSEGGQLGAALLLTLGRPFRRTKEAVQLVKVLALIVMEARAPCKAAAAEESGR